jgi:hypothetical protein
MPTSSAAMSPTALSLWLAFGAVTTIMVVAIIAWLVRSVARDAFAKARPADIPQVVLGLASLLGQARLMTPNRGNQTSTPIVPTQDQSSSAEGESA